MPTPGLQAGGRESYPKCRGGKKGAGPGYVQSTLDRFAASRVLLCHCRFTQVLGTTLTVLETMQRRPLCRPRSLPTVRCLEYALSHLVDRHMRRVLCGRCKPWVSPKNQVTTEPRCLKAGSKDGASHCHAVPSFHHAPLNLAATTCSVADGNRKSRLSQRPDTLALLTRRLRLR